MKTFVTDLRQGETIRSTFLLKKKELGKTKENKPYLKLEFGDKTGSIEGRMWDSAEEIDKRIDTGSAVVVQGVVDVWKNTVQIRVEGIHYASPGEYQQSDLIRCVENRDELFERIKSFLRKNISNKWMSLLIKEFLDDDVLIDQFKKAPGARSWHNAYVGGLLEHTYELIFIVERMCQLYAEANKDLALVGALFHDIGKVRELDLDTFEYTAEGGLIGHLPLAFEIVSNKVAAIKGFPKDLALHLKHIILAHHGEYEQQSPVLPKTIEAIIVYHADELVSQTNAVAEIMQTQSYGEREWSNFVTIKNRKFFLTRVEDMGE